MSYELIVGRKTPGDLLNLTNSVTTASWITQRTGNPGKLTFTYLRTPQSKIEEGDVVRFSADGELQFYGWVFSRGQDRWGPVDVVCYDRLRYLKANNSYTFYAQSAADIIKQICEDLQVDKKYIILNPALKAGDKVLLLRVQRGQKFVVLSRVYEGGD